MLHSIGNNNSQWCQNWLSVSLDHFESFCNYLQKKNYETLFLNEWYDLQNNPRLIHKKQIVLTFDDGYLDNWVFAFPILQKYGLQGTIFVNPEFVDPSKKKRLTIADVWKGNIAFDELETLGFLNWEEIKYMNSSSTIDIQSHSMSHNYYFKSDKIIDYYSGQNDYHWLAWIEKPDRKPFWITENQEDFAPFGYPVFEYGRALGLRRFIPSDGFIKSFITKYKELEVSNINNIIDHLINYSVYYKRTYGQLGKYENDKELNERFRYEIYESKRILEQKLNKKIEFLCWPGGGYNELSIKMSIDAGYKASTIASWENQRATNNIEEYKRIQRIGIGSFFNNDGKRQYSKNSNHLIYNFLSKRGNYLYKNIMRIHKYYYKYKQV